MTGLLYAEKSLVLSITGLLCREVIGTGHNCPSVQTSHWCWAWLAFCAEKSLVLGMAGILSREVIGAGHDWPSVQRSYWYWAWLAFCAEKSLVLGMTGLLCWDDWCWAWPGLLCREVIGAGHGLHFVQRSHWCWAWLVFCAEKSLVLGMTGLLCSEVIGSGHDWPSVQRSYWCWAWLAFCAEKSLVLSMTGLLCWDDSCWTWPGLLCREDRCWVWLAFCAENPVANCHCSPELFSWDVVVMMVCCCWGALGSAGTCPVWIHCAMFIGTYKLIQQDLMSTAQDVYVCKIHPLSKLDDKVVIYLVLYLSALSHFCPSNYSIICHYTLESIFIRKWNSHYFSKSWIAHLQISYFSESPEVGKSITTPPLMKALHNYSQEPLSCLADWLNHNGGDPQFSMGTRSWAPVQYKDCLSSYRDSYYKDKMVVAMAWHLFQLHQAIAWI